MCDEYEHAARRTPSDPRPLLLTVKQAADMIGVGRSTLYRVLDRGEITSVHLGASRRIPLCAVYAYIDGLATVIPTTKEGLLG